MEESQKKQEVSVVNKDENKQLTSISKQELDSLNYSEFDTPAKMMALGKVLVGSKMCPLKKPEDVVVALMRGNSLGLPPIVSINEIYPINGKSTLGIHIVRGILLQKGIWYKKTHDFDPMFEFALPPEKEGDDPIVVGTGFISEQPKGTLKGKRIVDRGTRYIFERQIKAPNGEYKTIEFESIFTIKDARIAELMDKDNWKQYPKQMLDARAFMYGARNIAGDYLNGIYLPSELINNVDGYDYVVDEEGRENVIDITSEIEE